MPLSIAHIPGLEDIAREARQRLQRVIEAVEA